MKVHFIKGEAEELAYFVESQKFIEVNDTAKNLIQAVCEEHDTVDIMSTFGLSEEKLNAFKRQISIYGKPDGDNTVNPIRNTMGLRKLVLNISNVCNLRCGYCYANGGSYCSDEGLMTKETAICALERFYQQYQYIHAVQIFGGEPAMNMPVIRAICEYVEQYNISSEKKTVIGMVTNGTILTEELIDMIRNYHIQVTVSYDGVPSVNDKMRIYGGGRGTSDVIINNIKKMKERTGQPTTIEATYNQQHVNERVSIMDIVQFVRKELGDIPLHIAPAGGDETCCFALENRNDFIQSVDDVFEEPEKSDSYTYSLVQRIVNALLNKRHSKHICEAGFATFSVSIKGEVYPCFMFTDVKELKFGNIHEPQLFENAMFQEGVEKFYQFNKESIAECKECFIQKNCSGCLGANYLETKDPFKLSESSCDMFRRMTERVIINLYRMSKQTEREEYAS